MSENNDEGMTVEVAESFDNDRLDSTEETLYQQTGEEYDEIFASAQMSVVEDFDIRTKARLCGPSGCGKTTLARSLSIDVKIADNLINTHGLDVWQMDMDKLAVFHHIVTSSDSDEQEDGKEVCPECGYQSFYSRSSKTPEYRCNNDQCGVEFEEPKIETEDDESEYDYMNQLESVTDIQAELQSRSLIDGSGDKTDLYPHSRANAYRDIYKVYEGGEFPSTPYFEVTMSHAKYAKDLIGHPHIGDNGTTFIKGKVTKAVEASNKETVVLSLDEINRAPTSAKDELYDALDGRVKISMDEAGGIEITGSASNIIIVSTMNKGSGHHVEPLDFAEKRRLGDTYYVDFLGVEYPEKEAELIVENSPVSKELASEMVRTANDIRDTAANGESNLSYGVPTGSLIVWAKKAFTNNLAGKSDPVIKAGASSVARAIFDHNEDEIQKVNTIISKNMQGVDFFQNDMEDETESDSTGNIISEKRYVCEDEKDLGCSWSAVESKADNLAKEFLICPECESGVNEVNPGE